MTDEVGVRGVEAGILAAEPAGEEVQYLTELLASLALIQTSGTSVMV